MTVIGNFCICSIVVGIRTEIVVMYVIQRRTYRPGIDNLLVLLIGGIPIAMPTVLSVTMAIASDRLSQQVGWRGILMQYFVLVCARKCSFLFIVGGRHKKDDNNQRNGRHGCTL